ncbi:MAG: NADP(H)-dependent aldo-keto reductase [Marinobacterium sp.]|nr:NADP(H)-dependent aldo-keto reductase [Marinobacterium sp.]
MKTRTLGSSDLNVSELCLGTMTFGGQNTEAEAHAQLDHALANGINFLDVAEMYPVPTSAASQGRSEQHIGSWLNQRGNRDQLVIATKAAGPAEMVSYLRPDIHFDRRNLEQAIEGSLQRLQSDYIDLYQLHWPDRAANFFGQLSYKHRPEKDGAPILETLQVLKDLVDAGKIRYIGLSNETPWGLMSFLKYADQLGLPRVVTVQNPYSLLHRLPEFALAEVMMREDVPLLAYSPLAFGTLTGKYLNDARPDGSRLALFPNYQRYLTPAGINATAQYVALAREHGLCPAQMALAFVNSREFLGSTIIGATSIEQLDVALGSVELALSDEVLAGIEAIHQQNPAPCP